MRLLAVCGACFALNAAAAQSAPRWTSMTIGLGAAVTSNSPDVYQGSPQVFARLGHAWTTNPKFAFEVEALGGRSLAEADCLSSSHCPGPGMNFVGVSGNGLWAFGRRVEASRSIVGAGLGLSRVAPTESHRVSPRAAPSVTVIAEAPVLVASRTALTLGLRGVAFPFVHGESLYLGFLTLGFRGW